MLIMYTVHDNDYYLLMETVMDDLAETLCLVKDETITDLYNSGGLETLFLSYLQNIRPESAEWFRENIEVHLFEDKSHAAQFMISEHGGLDGDREFCFYDLKLPAGVGQYWY